MEEDEEAWRREGEGGVEEEGKGGVEEEDAERPLQASHHPLLLRSLPPACSQLPSATARSSFTFCAARAPPAPGSTARWPTAWPSGASRPKRSRATSTTPTTTTAPTSPPAVRAGLVYLAPFFLLRL
eukprot:SAG22_NODE_27_length_29018_cov_465.809646_7_plen_127_part_00